MPAAAEITEPLIREYINRAITDVFKTMLDCEPRLVRATDSKPEDARNPHPLGPTSAVTPFVVGTVGFLGDINGLVYLYLDESFAKQSTGHLLGMTEPELEQAGDEVINDAIGELTNMTVGSFKNGLCDAGYPCRLTVPSILRGNNFSVEPISSAIRHTYNYVSGTNRIVADIMLRLETDL